MLNQMSRKLDQTVEDMETAKQRQLETEKDLIATETRLLAAEKDLNKTRDLLKNGKMLTKLIRF